MKIIEKNYWICLNDSRNCVENGQAAANLLGAADCETCKKYNDCRYCGRFDTTFCGKCINRTEVNV
jgi:hypothetical protein